MTAPRKLDQIAVLDTAVGIVLYARLDNGKIFRCVDRFDGLNPRGDQGPWVELTSPPGVKPFDGDNGSPDDNDERPAPRRRY